MPDIHQGVRSLFLPWCVSLRWWWKVVAYVCRRAFFCICTPSILFCRFDVFVADGEREAFVFFVSMHV